MRRGAGLLAAVLLCGCVTSSHSPVVLERTWWIMDATLRLRVEAADRRSAVHASESAFAAVRDADLRLSIWQPDSSLSQLNDAAAGPSVAVPPRLSRDIEAARACWTATDGAFDPVAAGARDAEPLPSFADLVPSAPNRYAKRRAGARLDSGGFGKGQALADAAAAIEETGTAVLAATMDFGGQTFWWRPASASASARPPLLPAAVAIAHPAHRDRPALELALHDYAAPSDANREYRLSVATSGDSTRGDHIVDPATRRPVVRRSASVTVIAASPFWADCLSTGLYVLHARSPDLAFRAAADQGVDMVALIADGEHVTASATAGLAGRVKTLLPGLRVAFP